MRVTGGISRLVGARWVEEAGAEVWGSSPVRTMGGWSNVDMAVIDLSVSVQPS